MKSKWRWLWLFVCFVVGIGLGLWQMMPPAPPPKDAAFDSMMANLALMARAAHPSGSVELAEVRTRLMAQIRAMGHEPLVEPALYSAGQIKDMRPGQGAATEQTLLDYYNESVYPDLDEPLTSLEALSRLELGLGGQGNLPLYNIWVKLDAPGTERGVMLVSHYDSTRSGPGAADDMVSVCAMLEAMREQSGRQGRKRDLYFLFTDGEEAGLLGARAFVQAHPDIRASLDFVANFEARGNRGGLLMFQTGVNNMNMVRQFAGAVSYPIGLSFFADVYHRMPNDTDFTVFLREGYQGLNFAVADGVEHYHENSDTAENLNRNTAYHYWQTISQIASYAADAVYDSVAADGDALFFPLLPGHLVVMPMPAAQAAAGAVLLLSLSWILFLLKRKHIAPGALVRASVTLLALMVTMGLLALGVSMLIDRLRLTGKFDYYASLPWALVCLLLVGLAAVLLVYSRAQRKTGRPFAFLTGLCATLMVPTALLAFLFPSLLQLFGVPLLVTLLFSLVCFFVRGAGAAARFVRMTAFMLAGVLTLLIFVPCLWITHLALLHSAMMIVAALAVVPMIWPVSLFGCLRWFASQSPEKGNQPGPSQAAEAAPGTKQGDLVR